MDAIIATLKAEHQATWMTAKETKRQKQHEAFLRHQEEDRKADSEYVKIKRAADGLLKQKIKEAKRLAKAEAKAKK
jgi:hypothetical protein